MEKLYYTDSYLKEFDAAVTDVVMIKGFYGIVLDKTAFYPEGGGQPFDTGFLNNVGVIEVHESNDVVYHYTKEPFEIGENVHGKIDWARRFSLMQEHSGEHILSGIIKSEFGFDNVGFHMGSQSVTIDINGVLTQNQLDKAELLANDAVYRNIDVEGGFFRKEQLAERAYRFKKEIEGDIRIVNIEGYDTCACCGIHCAKTGEIGIIKVIGSQKYKAGMRIYMLCGIRAFQDYFQKNKSTYDISVLLSAKQNEVSKATSQLLTEFGEQKLLVNSLKAKIITFVSEKIMSGDKSICLTISEMSPDELRRLSVALTEKRPMAATLSEASGAVKYAIASKSDDVRNITKELNEKFGGKGGGKAELTQGTIQADIGDILGFMKQKGFEATCL